MPLPEMRNKSVSNEMSRIKDNIIIILIEIEWLDFALETNCDGSFLQQDEVIGFDDMSI